jgi:GTP cyclohydrolase I
MRGIQKHNTDTITTYLDGAFFEDEKARAEFMSQIR